MATSIRKYNYYIGAFLYHIICKVIEPAMIIDCSENAKIIQFETNADKYMTFVKYSSSPNSKSEHNSTRKWNFIFSPKELEELNKLYEYNGKRLVVLVCVESSLTATEIAVIDLDTAKSCLGNDQKNIKKRITIVSNKNAHSLLCYGTAVSDLNAFKTSRSLDKHFI